MASTMTVCRTILQITNVVLLVFAILLTAAALFTPNWTTADIPNPSETHTHGLWEDCVRKNARGASWVCTYKEFGHEDRMVRLPSGEVIPSRSDGHHAGEAWILTVLCLIVTAVLLGLLASCLSCCAACWKCCSVFASVLTLVAALCSMIGVIVFIRNANDTKTKFILSGVEHAMQKIGFSFWLAVGGCVAFILSTIIGVLTTIVVFLSERSHQTWPQASKHTTI